MEEENLNTELEGSVPEEINKKGDKNLVEKVWVDRKISQEIVGLIMAKVWKICRMEKFLKLG